MKTLTDQVAGMVRAWPVEESPSSPQGLHILLVLCPGSVVVGALRDVVAVLLH